MSHIAIKDKNKSIESLKKYIANYGKESAIGKAYARNLKEIENLKEK